MVAGDWLVVYCKQGYRVEADIQSQVGYILTCRVPNNAEEPRWTGNSREYDYNKEMCKPIPAGYVSVRCEFMVNATTVFNANEIYGCFEM